MRLCLEEAQARLLAQHVLDVVPEEACGILAGVGEQVHEVIPIPNIADNPEHLYRLDDEVFAHALLNLEARGLELLGIYHSHPKGDPIPSPTDVRQATFPDTPYVIVGLRGGEPHLAAWRMQYGEVMQVELYVGLPSAAPRSRDYTLSRAQTIAIILSAILAFAFIIIVSLSLLPPAPVIVTPLP